MTNVRKLVPGLLLGLMIVMAGVSFAQNSKSTAGTKMESCCCKDSCPMMKAGATAATSDKHEGCCGDSCSMKDGAMKNHVGSTDKHECCCCGDSCSMKDGASKTGVASEKHECCCGDSCDMKSGAMRTMAMSSGAMDNDGCCCCGDSCDMKTTKDQKNRGH